MLAQEALQVPPVLAERILELVQKLLGGVRGEAPPAERRDDLALAGDMRLPLPNMSAHHLDRCFAVGHAAPRSVWPLRPMGEAPELPYGS